MTQTLITDSHHLSPLTIAAGSSIVQDINVSLRKGSNDKEVLTDDLYKLYGIITKLDAQLSRNSVGITYLWQTYGIPPDLKRSEVSKAQEYNENPNSVNSTKQLIKDVIEELSIEIDAANLITVDRTSVSLDTLGRLYPAFGEGNKVLKNRIRVLSSMRDYEILIRGTKE